MWLRGGNMLVNVLTTFKVESISTVLAEDATQANVSGCGTSPKRTHNIWPSYPLKSTFTLTQDAKVAGLSPTTY